LSPTDGEPDIGPGSRCRRRQRLAAGQLRRL